MRRIVGLLLAIIFAIAPLLTFIQPVQATTAIDIGSAAIDRTSNYSSGNTIIDLANPANETGTITSIEIWVFNDTTNLKIGTFYGSGKDYTRRDYITLGAVTSGAKRTFTAPGDFAAFNVTAGDFIGIYTNNGAMECSTSGGTALCSKAGDQFGAGLQTYSVFNGYAISVYCTGITPTVVPTLTTAAVTGNGYTAPNYLGTLNGEITATGGTNADYRGFVWSTSTHADPGNVAPVASAYSDNWTETGSFIAEAFSHQVTSFAGATVYYVRSVAHNSAGWAYGSEVSFTTLSTPTITTQAASIVSFTTARLNATVTSDGGQLSDVRFAYDNVTRANFALYANTTAWVTDNYSTGSNPYVDITGLTGATTYYFRVQIRNDVSSAEGLELTFTTANGVLKPTNVAVIPSSTSMSVSWTKGSGALYTLARYKLATYPTTTADGTFAYLGTGNSVSITGLTPGMTYYVSLWGFTRGTYSTDYATGMGTTLAYDAPGTGTGNAIEVPTDTGQFTQTPSTVHVANVPFHEAIESISTAYGTPLNMVWYVIWMIAGLAGGIMLYNRAGQGGQASYNLPMTFGAEAIWFGIGASIGLTMMWIVVLFLVVATGFTMFGNRH